MKSIPMPWCNHCCSYHSRKARHIERRAANSNAWALGHQTKRGFHVRRVVWGRMAARYEKRDGEVIRRAAILISK